MAWADYTADPAHPQIMVFDTATQTVTDLSNDLSAANLQPAVSPDESVMVSLAVTRQLTDLVPGVRQPHVCYESAPLNLHTGRAGSAWNGRVPLLAAVPDLGFYTARSYSLMRPPSTARRLIYSSNLFQREDSDGVIRPRIALVRPNP